MKDAPPTTPAAPAPANPGQAGGGAESSTTPGTEKGRGKKGKGKGKNKGKVTIDNPRNLCADFQVDQCKRNNCPFVHELGNAEEQKELEKLRGAIARARSRSASPVAPKQPCFQWAKTGTCKRGDKCQYSHDTAGQPEPKGKGKQGKQK